MNTQLAPHFKTTQDFSVEVKRALLTHQRFTTLSEIARSLGYHRNTVSRAVNTGCFPRVRKRVAKALSLPIP